MIKIEGRLIWIIILSEHSKKNFYVYIYILTKYKIDSTEYR